MPDVWLEWGGDFAISASGGLLLADGDDLAGQRIIRRICTAVRGYIFHPEYGAGLPQRIGRPGVASVIKAIVTFQIALEKAVATSPAPTVSVSEDAASLGAFFITIQYTAAATGEPVTLSFTV